MDINCRVYKVAVAVPVILIALSVVSSCASGSGPDAVSTTTETAAPGVSIDPTEDAFIAEVLRTADKDFSSVSRDEAIAAGRTVCTTLDEGSKWPDIVASIEPNVALGGVVGISIARAAVENFCPQYSSQLSP